MDCKLQTDIYAKKKGWPKFPPAQFFVTLGKFCLFGSTNILGRQKFGPSHIEIKFIYI